MRKLILPFLSLFILYACDNNKAESQEASSNKNENQKSSTSQLGYEFADAKYMDIGRSQLRLFESGNYDEWGKMFAENAVYQWSAGDSLVGRAAIVNYWKNRRMKFIDSIAMTNDIWLPIKVNQPQRGPDMPGVWLISWNQVDVKYKTGKKLMFWVHNDYHFNANDEIDRAVSYMDRAPVNAAIKQ
jgi:hypothetical protein